MLRQAELDRIRQAVEASFPDVGTVWRKGGASGQTSDGMGGMEGSHAEMPLLVYRCRVLPLNVVERVAAEKIHANARFKIHLIWNADCRPPDQLHVKARGVGPALAYEILGEDDKISEQACLTLLAGRPQ